MFKCASNFGVSIISPLLEYEWHTSVCFLKLFLQLKIGSFKRNGRFFWTETVAFPANLYYTDCERYYFNFQIQTKPTYLHDISKTYRMKADSWYLKQINWYQWKRSIFCSLIAILQSCEVSQTIHKKWITRRECGETPSAHCLAVMNDR